MKELSSKGDRFTWGGWRWKKWIQSCLDRSFGNKAWSNLFPDSNQMFLEKRGSDHRPVWLRLNASHDPIKGLFWFDKRFFRQPEVTKEIDKTWNGSNSPENAKVAVKLRNCRTAVSRWKRKRKFNAKDKISLLQQRLEWFQSRDYPCRFMIGRVKEELMNAYKEDEMFWRQKSRDKWLVFGDRGSKFFHASVKTNRSRNHIIKLKVKNNIDRWSDGAKAEVVVEYFSELFKSSNPTPYDAAFQSFTPKVSGEMNSALLKRVSKEEIRDAIFSIKSDSAPGPDGMTGAFFQKYWGIIGAQITKEIQEVFDTRVMPKEWNLTYICLLPKITQPEHMTDLRPISLCSVLYKVVSKILVRRVQPFLHSLVSVNQSAFVSERNIVDNIVIAHESVHALRVHQTISKEYMAVKTDMSKAFDRVEWSYVRGLLLAMGFDLKWVELVMMCITSVTFAVLMNDQPFGLITPQRGIRQGDPLSPFLFVLCTEGLTHLLNVVERNSLFSGLQFTPDGPAVHHILFADDSLFLCKASRDHAVVQKRILSFYGAATGQSINLQKSSITFGEKVAEEIRSDIRNVLAIFNEGGASKYLGLPECFSGSKVELLSYIK